MIIPVPNVGAIGLVTDLPPQELPLNAWTAARNIRFTEGKAMKFSGHAQVYGTPTWDPYWLQPIASGTAYYWMYAGTTKVGATDGSSHADITRVAGDYTTDLNVGWTGTVIEGVPVINNGAEVPQMWTPGLANKLVALTAWPATYTCRSMRSLKRYLVALDITKSVTRYPSMVKWSHQSPSGGVPTTWDETDETNDAGEYTLAAEGGFLIDGISLRDDLVLYKESQTYLMQYVAGIDIFRFVKKFSEMGMLSRKCAVEFFIGKHVVFSGDDVVLHDGQQGDSIISRRLISSIAGQIDSTYYQRSFVAMNYPKKEVWVCFPERGSSLCTKAAVWNWKENVWGFRDLPNAAFIASGVVNPISSTELWSGASGDWSTDTDAWQDRSYDPAQRKMLIASPSVTKLFTPDTTQQFDAMSMTATLERTALGFPLKANNPPDYTTEKLVQAIWPRIRGTAGGTVNVYLGTQERVDGAVTWSTAFPFTIGVTEYCDFVGEMDASKLHAIKFESIGDVTWELDGYDAEVVPAGHHGSR